MGRRFDGFRHWLDRNKIIFETVAATLLSVMAMVVSIAQTLTASRQTQLLAFQTQLAEANALPQFELAIHQKLNDETGKYDDDYLVVSNQGGPIHEFLARDAYFLKISVANMKQLGRGNRKAEVPVNGYFTASFPTLASTGVLLTMTGNHNNAAFGTLFRGALKAGDDNKWGSAMIEETHVVRLNYRDLLDREHEDYYQVEPVTGGWRLPDNDGKAMFERWRTAHRPELAQLKLEDLLAIASDAPPTRE